MSPELLLNREANEANDVWGFACSLVELYSEDLVWDLEGYKNTFLCVQDNFSKKNIPDLSSVPLFLGSILKESFDYDATKRPSMIQFKKLFEKETRKVN